MGLSQSKNTETINWQNIKTDDMSSTIPNLSGISREAKDLISKLNLPEISDSTSEFNVENILVNNKAEKVDDDLSSSPFISSEMYNYLINKYNTNKTNMTGGAKIDEEADTSSTTDSDDEFSEKKEKHTKKTKKSLKGKKSSTKNSENYLSYVSSSAHTGGSLSEESIQNENEYSISSVNTSDINMISE